MTPRSLGTQRETPVPDGGGMAPRIRVLPDQVANQIAAGEVIERPASVLKELVENALDAGATQIEVEAAGGGARLLRVTDNGCGMGRDDAVLCLERHATSKLRTAADLGAVLSYGFRGEALPSIASVSKFRLRTREPHALSGTEVRVDGGKLLDVREAGLAPGTEVEVRSLFFNLPARRKFLRSENTETAHLRHHLLLAGLSRPDVGFACRLEGSAPARWPAGQATEARIAAALGQAFARDLVPVQARDGDLRLSGFVGKPGIGRPGRHEQYWLVNRRPVTNRSLQFGLQDGYEGAIPRGLYPIAVLLLELDPASLDVNVHPAKREIRFHDDYRIKRFIAEAVARAIRISPPRPRASPPAAASASCPPHRAAPSAAAAAAVVPVDAASFGGAPPTAPVRLELRPEALAEPLRQQALPLAAPPQAGADASGGAAPMPGPPRLRLIGSIDDDFIVSESAEGLVLIDRRAARERILFENLLRRLDEVEPASQRLLLPVKVELPPREASVLSQHLDTLNRMGVSISAFGSHTFLLDALPPLIKTADATAFLHGMAAELLEGAVDLRRGRRLDRPAIVRAVCRLAAQAAPETDPGADHRLVDELLACELPYTCPNGRPTMIQFSRPELERKFGRR